MNVELCLRGAVAGRVHLFDIEARCLHTSNINNTSKYYQVIYLLQVQVPGTRYVRYVLHYYMYIIRDPKGKLKLPVNGYLCLIGLGFEGFLLLVLILVYKWYYGMY